MSGKAPVDATESVGRARIFPRSYDSVLGLVFICLGVLFVSGAVSLASGGQNTESGSFSQNSSTTAGSQDPSMSGPAPAWPNSQTPLAGAAITPESGVISNGSYTNSYFNFSYRLPEQWQSRVPVAASGNEYQEDSSGTSQDGKKYLLLDVRDGNDSLELVAIDTAEENNITPSEVVVAEMGALRSLGGKMAGAAVEKEIGGRTFWISKAQVNGEVRGAAETLYAGFAAAKQGSYVLTWTFFADTPARLEQLLGTLESVSFEK
jgi:hypothetical protein